MNMGKFMQKRPPLFAFLRKLFDVSQGSENFEFQLKLSPLISKPCPIVRCNDAALYVVERQDIQ